MQPAVIKAIHDWELAWNRSQEAATHAMRTAFPPLDHSKTPAYCCDIMLAYEHEGIGSGRLCIDDYCRATIEFEGVPNQVIADAVDETFGIGWFDYTEGRPLMAAGPGTYNWDDESTSAEYEVSLGEDGLGRVYIAYVPVPDAAAVLAALTAASSCHTANGET
ncbi:hypothetical protein [Streptomyces chattanoogensis]|uniref:hypothetical protein n=1 Tax=Streptomyces chattanoogensis TaxID=66876 RepID=UPI0036CE2840